MRVLFVTHNSIATPLVRSQVLPYLRGTMAKGVDAHLVTFERARASFPHGEFPHSRWHPVSAGRGSGLALKALDWTKGIARVVGLVLRHRVDVIHARSYLPAAVALPATWLTNRPYVFDMRGFLGEEYVETGHWREGETRERLLRLAERWLLRGAAEIVVLTEAAAERLRADARYAPFAQGKRVNVVPCMVDIDRFRPGDGRGPVPTLVYSGSVGTWYELGAMLRLFAEARAAHPRLRFLILNLGQQEMIRREVSQLGVGEGIAIEAVEFERMPEVLARAHAGICLLRPGKAKTGSSPIKVAEYLACGLPVVLNEGQGDLPDLVRRYGAGHVLRNYAPDEIRSAASRLVRLVADEEARRHARSLAEDRYDLRRGVETYLEVYSRLGASR